MKRIIVKTLIILIASCAFASVSAQDNRTFSDIWSGQYRMYYTPVAHEEFVADPFPFYDNDAQCYRVMFITDRRATDHGAHYHPISEISTTSAFRYRPQPNNPVLMYGGDGSLDAVIGTGHVIKMNGIWFMFYTGVSANPSGGERQVIMRAHSNDGVTWSKDTDFPTLYPPTGYMQFDFRDPCVIKVGNKYKMIVTTRTGQYYNGVHETVLEEYESDDLWTWTDRGVFMYNADDHLYECADIFELNGHWYLLYSDAASEADPGAPRHVRYHMADSYEALRSMSSKTTAPAQPYRCEGRLDGRQFYAAKSASNGNERLVWGWCATRFGQNYNNNEAAADFGGALVCHRLVTNSDGTLGFACPEGIKAGLSNLTASHEATTLSAGKKIEMPRIPTNARIEFTVKTTPGTSMFGMNMVDCSDLGHNYRIAIEDKYNCLKFQKGSTDINMLDMHGDDIKNWFKGEYRVTMIVDRSVAVVYINDQYAFTNRIYGMEGNPWSLYCSEGNISVSQINVYSNANDATVLWDGESHELGSKGGLWDDGMPEVVVNTWADETNSSEQCLQFTATPGSATVKLPLRDWCSDLDLQGNRRLSLSVRKPSTTNVMIELSDPTDGSASYWQKAAAWYGNVGEWQKVVLDFSTNDINDYPGVMSVTLTDVNGMEDVCIDNIIVEPEPRVNGIPLRNIPDGSLSGRLVLTGSWMKGDCQNTNGNWVRVEYNDYATLARKIKNADTSVDFFGATTLNLDTAPIVATGATVSNTTTLMHPVANGHGTSSQQMFSITGQRINNIKRGVYILNNKKYVK